jgi:hypothetical protein
LLILRELELAICRELLENAVPLQGNFCRAKANPCRAARAATAIIKIEEVNVGYLIAVAVLTMMSLYALIIVQGLSQPEW